MKATRVYFFIVCLMIQLITFAQTHTQESEELYAQAVELYNQGKYSECIPLFLKVDSLEYIEQQRTTDDNHWVASAYYKLGDEKMAVAYSSNFAYQLPVADGRLTTKSDSLFLISEKAFADEDYKKCEEYLNLAYKTLLIELNGESVYSLTLESNKAIVAYLSGRRQEGIDAIYNIVKKCSLTYGEKCLYQYKELSNFSVWAGVNGDIELMEQISQKMFELMQQNNVLNPFLLCEHYRMIADVYLQSNKVLKAKEFVKLQFDSMTAAYGKESPEYINQLIGWSSAFSNIKEYEYALTMIDEAEEMAVNAFGKRSTWYSNVVINKADILQKSGCYKEAQRYVKISKTISTGNTEFQYAMLLAKSSSLISKLRSKHKLKEKDVKEALGIYNTLLQEVGTHDNTLSVIAMSFATVVMNYDLHLAAEIVDKHLDAVLAQNTSAPLIMAGLVYLSAELYVKARQANSAAMQKLHASMESRMDYTTAMQAETYIDVGLELLKNYTKKGFSSDTIGYSVAMIHQDMLYAKLLIKEQQDSITTPTFFKHLKDCLKIAYGDTQDMVMGDSIFNRYRTLFITRFGEGSDLYTQLLDLKEHVEFEIENPGAYLALELRTKTKETFPDFYVEKARYEDALEEYNKEFEDWKTRRSVGAEMKWNDGPKMPKIEDVRINKNFEEAMAQYEAVVEYWLANTDSRAFSPMASWCECADSLNMEYLILPKLKKWAYDKNSLLVHNPSPILSLVTIYRHIDIDAYTDFADSLFIEHCNRFVVVYPEEKILMFKASSLINLLSNITHIDAFENCMPDSVVLNGLQSIMKEMNQHERLKQEVVALDYFISSYMWSYYWKIGIKERTVLLPHFIELYELIKTNEELQHYQESYHVLNMLCSLTTDYSHYDKEMTIKADSLRKQIRHNCEEDDKNLNQHRMPKTVLYNANTRTIIRLADFQLEELENRIINIYANEDYAARYDKIINDWNRIRTMQHEGFYSEEDLSDAVEKLSKESVSYMNNDSLISLAYDIALFSKGYLLRSEQRITKVIEQSGNRTVLKKYHTYLHAKQQLDDSSISSEKADSLRSIVRNTLNELRRGSQRFDDYTIGMESSWRDVQAQLDDDEIAIEYVFDGWRYHTIFIKKGFEVPLADYYPFDLEYSIHRAGDSLYIAIDPIYGLWPFSLLKNDNGQYVLTHPLEGVKRIYFAPTGALHQLSMENLISDNGQRMCERFEMHRLSSTREIITYKQQNQKPRTQKAVLFGGVVYDFDDDDWQQVAQQNGNADNVSTVLRDVPVLTRAAVSTLDYLPGTLTEVTDINNIIESNKTSSTIYTGKASTEESFKLMSGTDASVLHIATHGYYQKNDSDSESLISNSGAKDNKESNSMSRSGLFLAGASSILEGEKIPQNVEDGILTAREISTLDLTNISLVTLSACETGLGDVSSEGVFGLQRGFKKAGANSILMSLWKVDDAATCKLMTEFYSNWIGKKMTKHDALEAAKKTVRETKGWEDPKYWAAFILLDGLD